MIADRTNLTYVENGSWDGTVVVSPQRVKASVTPAMAVAAAPNAPRYGLKWWLYPDPRNSAKFTAIVGP
jgi:hypothetical protein